MQTGAPHRVLVVGVPGSGKTWVATRLADAWTLPHVELDAFKLKPHRQLAAPEELDAALRSVVATDRWLLDGNWNEDEIAQSAWSRADLVVHLDYCRVIVLGQTLRRSLRRLLRREAYFGWDERLRDWLSPTYPLRWSWRMAAPYQERYARLAASCAPKRYVVLHTRADADRLVRR